VHHGSGPLLPLLVLGFLFLLALAALGGLAWLAMRAAKSAGNGPGAGVAAGLGGCGLAAVLGCLGLCTLIAFLVAAALFFSARVVDRATDFIPSRVEIRSAQPPAPDRPGVPGLPPSPGEARLVFTIEGDFHDVPRFEGLIREISDGEVSLVERTDIETPDGPRQRIVFSVPVDRHELREIEREIRKRLPNFRIEEGVVIEFEGPEQDF